MVRSRQLERPARLLFAAGFLGRADDAARVRVLVADAPRRAASSIRCCTITWSRGRRSSTGSVTSCCRSASLTLLTMAAIARYQRAAMLEVLPADYIRTARAKGVARAADHLAPRAAHRAHADGHAARPAAARACSAARCSSRRCSRGRAWECSRRTRSARATTTSSRRRSIVGSVHGRHRQPARRPAPHGASIRGFVNSDPRRRACRSAASARTARRAGRSPSSRSSSSRRSSARSSAVQLRRPARHRRPQERAAVVVASVRHRPVQPRRAHARVVRRADLARHRDARRRCSR